MAAKSKPVAQDAGSVRSRMLRARPRTTHGAALQRASAREMCWWRPKSSAFADLPADVLALVADALALVRLRRPRLADIRGDLADGLLVGALDNDLGRRGHVEGDAGRSLDHHRVREPDVQLQVGA